MENNIAEIQEVNVADPAEKLFLLLQVGQNSSSFTSRTKSSESLEEKNQDPASDQPIHENLGGKTNPEVCNSKHNTSQGTAAATVSSLFKDSNEQEEARYLAMFREFYEIPTSTDIA
jgi:hypothetical protein